MREQDKSRTNMRAVSSSPNIYVQILHLAAGVLAAILQNAYFVIRSTYQLLIPQAAKSLHGQVVLVTGAGHGIGRELALEFWRHGCTVACVDTDETANNITARDINKLQHHKSGGSLAAHPYTCNVRDRNQVAALTNTVLRDLGHVDILVNNTNMNHDLQVQPTQVIEELNNKLLSHFWTVLAFLPGMVERKQGHIVAISSVAGLSQLSEKAPHSASKYAAEGLMNALSEELHLESHNIKLTCAYPYVLNTRTDLPEQLNLRIPELSPEHAAREIVNAVRHNMDTVTVPRNLHFWLNVFRTLPQDATDVWRDMFNTRAVPTVEPSSTTLHTQVTTNSIKT